MPHISKWCGFKINNNMVTQILVKKISYPRYKYLVKMDRWCEKRCSGKWQHARKVGLYGSIVPNYDIYEFVDPKDAICFKLEWG